MDLISEVYFFSEICYNDLMEDNAMNKLTSRKFWITVAAVLASLGTTVGGIITGNETLAIVASVCTALSAAIYAGAEAYVDAKAVDTAFTVFEEDAEEDDCK